MSTQPDRVAEAAPAFSLRTGFLGAVSFCGADTRKFLQGMLTGDVEQLDDRARWQHSALCNPKGRIIANFVLWRSGEDSYRALMAEDLVEGFCAHLSRFVLRAKVRIEPCEDRCLFADGGGATSPVGQEGSGEVRETGEGTVLAGVGGLDLLVPGPQQGNGQERGDPGWLRAQIGRGIPWVTKATQEMFIAQSINYDLLGGVSFKKGCFVGQEVIARVHYRGEPKSRMYRISGEGPPPEAGAPVQSQKYGDQTAGNVVNASPGRDGQGFVALVSARKSVVTDGVSVTAGGETRDYQPEEPTY